MKGHVISILIVLAILVIAWTAFGQEQEKAERGRQFRSMSQEEREKVRARILERLENMSEEEREKYRADMRSRFDRRTAFWNPEMRQKSIKVIEEQLAKLKVTAITLPEGGFRDLSEEERNKFRDKSTTSFREWQNALQGIIAQVAILQGRRQPKQEDKLYLIVSTNELKQIQDLAKKERAKETLELLNRLAERRYGWVPIWRQMAGKGTASRR